MDNILIVVNMLILALYFNCKETSLSTARFEIKSFLFEFKSFLFEFKSFLFVSNKNDLIQIKMICIKSFCPKLILSCFK